MSKDPSLIQFNNQLAENIFSPYIKEINNATVCFFYDEDNKQIQGGCGVFVKSEDNYYILSAAHVLAEHVKNKYIILKDKELILGGKIFSSKMPPTNIREDDSIDVSIIQLDIESAQYLLTRFNPISKDKLGFKHDIKNSTTYLISGYPKTKSKSNAKSKIIQSKIFSYRTKPNFDFDFTKSGFDYQKTIAVSFDGHITSKSNPHKHKAPDVDGISGSGLWYIDIEMNQMFLVGIVIQYIKERPNKAILATRIDYVFMEEIFLK
ncbi:MAG: hypothetical protein KUL78_06080 [Flavobacterium sp.]|nr:hypothetical protein [Flavobacterium sp.]